MQNNQQYKNLLKAGLTKALQRVGVSNPRTVFLGDPTQVGTPVIVPSDKRVQAGMVYVYSVGDGTINVEQALNDGGMITFDDTDRHFPVEVGYARSSKLLKIVGLPPEAYLFSGGASPQQVALKASTMLTANRFQELRLVPQSTPDLTLQLRGGFWIDGNQVRWAEDTPVFADLTSHLPSTTGEARYVHVAVDANGAAVYVDGATFGMATEDPETEHYPTTFGGGYSLGFIKLVNGQTQITEDHLRFPLGLYSGTGITPLELGGTNTDTSAWPGSFAFFLNGLTVEVRCVGASDRFPTATDDATQGFTPLSRWQSLVSVGAPADSVWELLDDTPGAAIWVRLDGSGGGGGSMNDFTVAADSGTPAVIGDGVTLTLAGGTGLATALTGNTVTTRLTNTPVTPGSYVGAAITIDAQGRITAASSGSFQPLNSNLTALAGLTPANDDIIQRKGGVWVNRTLAQLKTDLAYSFGQLGDTPSAYNGANNRLLMVNSTPNALQFATGGVNAEVDNLYLEPTVAAGTGYRTLGHFVFSATAADLVTFDTYRSRGNRTTPSGVSANDRLMLWQINGHDGANYRTAASLEVIVNGSPGASDMPGAFIFRTTPDGSASPVESLRIDQAGTVAMRRMHITGSTPVGLSALTIGAALLGNDLFAVQISPALSTQGAAGLMQIQGTVTPTATLTALYGILFIPTVVGSSSFGIAAAYGMFLRVDTGASYTGTVTDLYGLFIATPTKGHVSAAFTHTYGLYIQNQADYAIFTNGGEVRIGGAFRHVGTTFGLFGVTPAGQQVGGVATAGVTWTATEQAMLNKAYGALRTFGHLS